jgi:hypothetical protein
VLAGQDGANAAPGGEGPRGSGNGGAGSGPANSGPHAAGGLNGTSGLNGSNGNGRAPGAPPTAAGNGASDLNGHAPSANGIVGMNGVGRAPGVGRANGAGGSNGTMARLTPLPRPADVAPAPQNGHNGANGHNGNGANGALHDGSNSYISVNGGDPTAGFASAPDAYDARELEALALADPLVREFIKELPARLVEVSPLDPDAGR